MQKPRFDASGQQSPQCKWAILRTANNPKPTPPRRLSIAYRGIATIVFLSMLDKAGNSDTAERIALMERFLAVFGAMQIAALPSASSSAGEAWFR